MQGQLTHVTGRKARGGQRGFPALDELSMRMDDGREVAFGGRTVEPGSLRGLAGIHPAAPTPTESGGQAVCPICLEGEPTTEEHVPQRDLGGHVMTLTCAACNNGLGSRVEVDLLDWFDHRFTHISFAHDGEVPGRRRVPDFYYRKAAESDEWLLFVDGSFTPEVEQMLASGAWEMKYRPPDPRRYGLALLKHAYLAACLYMGFVPDTPSVRAVRADLLAVRDLPRRQRPPASEAAQRLRFYRSGVGRQGPPLALVLREPEDREVEPEPLISLAGVLFVSWPFTDILPNVDYWLPDAEAPAG